MRVHAQTRDCIHELIRVNVRSNIASACRCSEKRSESWSQMVFAAFRDIRKRRIAEEGGAGQSPLADRQGHEKLSPSLQGLERRSLRQERRCRCCTCFNLMMKHCRHKIGPAREVPVKGANADTGPIGYLSDRCVQPRHREDRLGGFQEFLDVASRVRTRGTSGRRIDGLAGQVIHSTQVAPCKRNMIHLWCIMFRIVVVGSTCQTEGQPRL